MQAACWSAESIYSQQKTPCGAFFRAEDCPVLGAAAKKLTKFVDVFDPMFTTAIEHGIDSCESAIGAPWCIGFYVDNELYWGDDHSLALWTLTAALKHPNIVGTHWFQYVSESTSGRGDGENYQVGFIDICDTPYVETVAAAREIGSKMHDSRDGKE